MVDKADRADNSTGGLYLGPMGGGVGQELLGIQVWLWVFSFPFFDFGLGFGLGDVGLATHIVSWHEALDYAFFRVLWWGLVTMFPLCALPVLIKLLLAKAPNSSFQLHGMLCWMCWVWALQAPPWKPTLRTFCQGYRAPGPTPHLGTLLCHSFQRPPRWTTAGWGGPGRVSFGAASLLMPVPSCRAILLAFFIT